MKHVYTRTLTDDRGFRQLAILDVVNGYISRINVPVRHRGKGVGRALLQECLADADKEGVRLHLYPSESDGLRLQELIDWYERYGFRQDDEYSKLGWVREPRPL
jgi:ribosomal protein S18 acetylase RimI-like enzyme